MNHEYQLSKNILGQVSVKYDCVKCGERLKSPIADAGKKDNCPNCLAQFTVPGLEEKQRIDTERALAACNKEISAEKIRQQRIARERQEHIDKLAKEEERRKRVAEQLRYEEERPQSQMTQVRNCPFCAEEILAAATKCKHCGEFLDGRASKTQVQDKGNSGCNQIIIIAFGIVLAVIILAFF
jgi:acyl-CoA reductase-like NAD-dependent aldehyde dehydrogenase